MAWITKNSGTMEVERRDEPYIDARLREKIENDILPRYPRKQAGTLPVLHLLQEEHGWLPYQAMEEAAEVLEVAPSEVLDTATFYEEFWLEPHGKYVIWLCQSISCEIMGEPSLTQRIGEHLGIEPGETTEDGKFTLMKVECLGACGGAPCGLVNEKLHENINADNFAQVLDALE